MRFSLLIDVKEWVSNGRAQRALPPLDIRNSFSRSHRPKGESRTRNLSESVERALRLYRVYPT